MAKKEPKFVELVNNPETGEQQAVADTSHLKERRNQGIYEGGRVIRSSSDINCEATHASGHGHSGPATHFFTAEGESEEQATPLCARHLAVAQEHAYANNKNIDVRSIKPDDARKYKLLSSTRNLEIRTAMEGILLSKGLTGEDALVGRHREALGASGKPPADATAEILARRTPEEKKTALEAALEKARSGEKGYTPKPLEKAFSDSPAKDKEHEPAKYMLFNLGTPEQKARGGKKTTRAKLAPGEGQEPLGEGKGLVDAAFRYYVHRSEDPKDLEAVMNMSEEEHNAALDSINSARERESLGIPQEGIKPRGFSKQTYTTRQAHTTGPVVMTYNQVPGNRAISVTAPIKPAPEKTYGGIISAMEGIAERGSSAPEPQSQIEHFQKGHGESRNELPSP